MGRKSGRGSQLRRAAELKTKRTARGASPTPTPDYDGTRTAADAVDTAASAPIAPAAPRAMSLSDSDDDGRGGDGRAPRPALSLSASASPERNGGDKAPPAAAPAPAAPRPRPTAYDVGEGARPPAEGQVAKWKSEVASFNTALAPSDADTAAVAAAATAALAALSTLEGGITASLALPPPAPALTHAVAVGVVLAGVPSDGADAALASAAAALKSAADGAAFTSADLLKGGKGEPRVRAVAASVGEGGAVATVNVVVASAPPPADTTTDPLATAFTAHPAAGPATRVLDALLRARCLMADGPRGGGGAPPRALAALVAAHAAAIASAGGDTSADAAADLVLSFCRRVGVLDASTTAVDASGAFVPRADAGAWAAAPPPPPARRLAVADPATGADIGAAITRTRELQSSLRRCARGLAGALAASGGVVGAVVDATAAARRGPPPPKAAASDKAAGPQSTETGPSFDALSPEARDALTAAVRRRRLKRGALDARAVDALSALPPRGQAAVVAEFLGYPKPLHTLRNASAYICKLMANPMLASGDRPPRAAPGALPLPPRGRLVCAEAGALLDAAARQWRLPPGALSRHALDALADLPPRVQIAAAEDLLRAPPRAVEREGADGFLRGAVEHHARAIGAPPPPSLGGGSSGRRRRSRSRSRSRDRRRSRTPPRRRSRSRDRDRRRRTPASRSPRRRDRTPPPPPPVVAPGGGHHALRQVEALEAGGRLPLRCLDERAVAAISAAPPSVAAAAVAELAAAAAEAPLRNPSAFLMRALATNRARR